eukprot:gene1605-6_t
MNNNNGHVQLGLKRSAGRSGLPRSNGAGLNKRFRKNAFKQPRQIKQPSQEPAVAGFHAVAVAPTTRHPLAAAPKPSPSAAAGSIGSVGRVGRVLRRFDVDADERERGGGRRGGERNRTQGRRQAAAKPLAAVAHASSVALTLAISKGSDDAEQPEAKRARHISNGSGEGKRIPLKGPYSTAAAEPTLVAIESIAAASTAPTATTTSTTTTPPPLTNSSAVPESVASATKTKEAISPTPLVNTNANANANTITKEGLNDEPNINRRSFRNAEPKRIQQVDAESGDAGGGAAAADPSTSVRSSSRTLRKASQQSQRTQNSQPKHGRWPAADDVLLWRNRAKIDDVLKQQIGRSESAIRTRLRNLSDVGHKAHAGLQVALDEAAAFTSTATATAVSSTAVVDNAAGAAGADAADEDEGNKSDATGDDSNECTDVALDVADKQSAPTLAAGAKDKMYSSCLPTTADALETGSNVADSDATVDDSTVDDVTASILLTDGGGNGNTTIKETVADEEANAEESDAAAVVAIEEDKDNGDDDDDDDVGDEQEEEADDINEEKVAGNDDISFNNGSGIDSEYEVEVEDDDEVDEMDEDHGMFKEEVCDSKGSTVQLDNNGLQVSRCMDANVAHMLETESAPPLATDTDTDDEEHLFSTGLFSTAFFNGIEAKAAAATQALNRSIFNNSNCSSASSSNQSDSDSAESDVEAAEDKQTRAGHPSSMNANACSASKVLNAVVVADRNESDAVMDGTDNHSVNVEVGNAALSNIVAAVNPYCGNADAVYAAATQMHTTIAAAVEDGDVEDMFDISDSQLEMAAAAATQHERMDTVRDDEDGSMTAAEERAAVARADRAEKAATVESSRQEVEDRAGVDAEVAERVSSTIVEVILEKLLERAVLVAVDAYAKLKERKVTPKQDKNIPINGVLAAPPPVFRSALQQLHHKQVQNVQRLQREQEQEQIQVHILVPVPSREQGQQQQQLHGSQLAPGSQAVNVLIQQERDGLAPPDASAVCNAIGVVAKATDLVEDDRTNVFADAGSIEIKEEVVLPPDQTAEGCGGSTSPTAIADAQPAVLVDDAIKDTLVADGRGAAATTDTKPIVPASKRRRPMPTLTSAPIIKRHNAYQEDDERLNFHHWLPPSNHVLTTVERYLAEKYTHLFPWQAECMAKALSNTKHLVYSAPTSAGKSLVAELLAIRTVALGPKTRTGKNKKVLFCLPFRALTAEKARGMKKMVESTGLEVENLSADDSWKSIDDVDIALCTYEKANSIVNTLLRERSLDHIGMIVVDELHMIGDEGRGFYIEMLLAKIFQAQQQVSIVGMSATLLNMHEITQWLGNSNYYETDYRPVKLEEFVCDAGRILQLSPKTQTLVPVYTDRGVAKTIKNASASLMCAELCRETVADNCSAIVFSSTKKLCTDIACDVAKDLGRHCKAVISNSRADLDALVTELEEKGEKSQFKNSEKLLECVKSGVAWHNADLTDEQRDIIEVAYRKGVLKVLVATTTVSAGVNLPARRVIIHKPVFWHGKTETSLKASTYQQMVGRAGRTGLDDRGESYVVCALPEKSSNEKRAHAEKEKQRQAAECLVQRSLERTESQIGNVNQSVEISTTAEKKKRKKEKVPTMFARAILEIVSTRLITNTVDLEHFIRARLLLSVQNSRVQDRLLHLFGIAMQYLKEHKFLREKEGGAAGLPKLVVEGLGNATVAGAFDVDRALVVHNFLHNSTLGLILASNLQLLYLCTPLKDNYDSGGLYSSAWRNKDPSKWQPFADAFNDFDDHQKAAAKNIGVSQTTLNLLANGSTPKRAAAKKNAHFFCKTMLLSQLVNEVSRVEVSKRFKVTIGYIEKLQKDASVFVGQVKNFCAKMNSGSFAVLGKVLELMQSQLDFGVDVVLLDLCQIRSIKPSVARLLYNADIQSVEQLARTAVDVVEDLLDDSKLAAMPGESKTCAKELAEQISEEAIELRACQTKEIELKNMIKKPRPAAASATFTTATDVAAVSASAPAHQSAASPAGSGDRSIESSRADNSQLFDTMFACGRLMVWKAFCKDWETQETFSFGLDISDKTLVGISVMWDAIGERFGCWYISLGGETMEGTPTTMAITNTQDGRADVCVVSKSEVHRMLNKMLGGPALKIGVNLKAAWKVLHALTIKLAPPFHDPAVMLWLLNPDDLSTAPETAMELHDDKFCKLMQGAYKGRRGGGDSVMCCKDTHVSFVMHGTLKKNLVQASLFAHFEDVEMALVPILGQMELDGIAADGVQCKQEIGRLVECQSRIQKRAYELAGEKFILTNAGDISRILFDKLKYVPSKKIVGSDRERRSTKKDVLMDLEEQDLELPKLVRLWRKIEKVIGTHCSQLQIVGNSSRVQFSCNVFTATGRIAVNNPNLQNIPKVFDIPMLHLDDAGKVTEEGTDEPVQLRNILVAREGCKLVAFDYKQIELRMIAVLSQDPTLIDELNNDSVDIFKTMARNLLKMEAGDEVTKDQRQKAKGATYGTMYGMGKDKMASNFSIESREADRIMKAWKSKYPVADKWKEEASRNCKKTRKITLPSGRIRTYKELKPGDKDADGKLERQTVNNLAQGSAADVVKQAMIDVTQTVELVSSALSGQPLDGNGTGGSTCYSGGGGSLDRHASSLYDSGSSSSNVGGGSTARARAAAAAAADAPATPASSSEAVSPASFLQSPLSSTASAASYGEGDGDARGGGGRGGRGGGIGRPKARLILQIHDELLFEVPEELLEGENNVAQQIRDVMEATPGNFFESNNLKFPVRMEIGDSWGSLEEVL